MRYDLYDYVASLPVRWEADDGIVKIVNAREAMMALPAADNVRRDADQIPDVPVELLLSKKTELPRYIRDVLAQSRSPYLFAADSQKQLGALCLNGRGYPIRLFVHLGLLAARPDSESEFERLFQHEYIHGGEGVRLTPQGPVRSVPWSFRFQSRLNALNRRDPSCPDLLAFEDPYFGAFVTYLREGYDVQGHVSEMFARVATLMTTHIRATGHLPCTGQDICDCLAGYGLHGKAEDVRNERLSNCDADDLALTLAAQGNAARTLAWFAMPKMVHAAARLSGYVI